MRTRKRKNGKKKLGNVSKSFRNKSACDTRVKVRGNSHRESTKSEKQDSKLRRNTITFCAQFCPQFCFPSAKQNWETICLYSGVESIDPRYPREPGCYAPIIYTSVSYPTINLQKSIIYNFSLFSFLKLCTSI